MKENLATISQGPLSQFAVAIAGRSHKNHLPRIRDNIVLLLRKNVLEWLATLGTGVILFIAITLFLLQLAEHGWEQNAGSPAPPAPPTISLANRPVL